jgi:hypothetical protein
MPRDPNIPDPFDVYTVVVLRRPAGAPEMSDEELDALQARHLAHRAELRARGMVVVNGPFDEQTDQSYRGMSIFACDPAEAAWWVARLPTRRPPGRRPMLDARRLTRTTPPTQGVHECTSAWRPAPVLQASRTRTS